MQRNNAPRAPFHSDPMEAALPKRSTETQRRASPKDRTPLERERDNVRSDSVSAPAQTGKASAKNSYGPFGRGDREDQGEGKAPRK